MNAVGLETIAVSDFSTAISRIETALDYPGQRPESSFLTDGTTVTILPDSYPEFKQVANEQLTAAGLPPIEARIPVLAYGANASPSRLHTKMEKFGSDAQELMQTVPHIIATLPDVAAVWHGQPGQLGAAFAELYNQAEATGTELHAHVAFMTRNQLMALHTSEGETYSAALLPVTLGSGAEQVKVEAVSYVALDSQILLSNDKPVLIREVKHQNTELPSLQAEEVVDMMLAAASQKTTVPDNARAYIKEGIDLSLGERKARQARVHEALADLGMLRDFRHVDVADEATSSMLIGRADFASLPNQGAHVLHIPEQVLAAIRPSERDIIQKVDNLRTKNPTLTTAELRKKAANVLDPARLISRRAHCELATRLALVDK